MKHNETSFFPKEQKKDEPSLFDDSSLCAGFNFTSRGFLNIHILLVVKVGIFHAC